MLGVVRRPERRSLAEAVLRTHRREAGSLLQEERRGADRNHPAADRRIHPERVGSRNPGVGQEVHQIRARGVRQPEAGHRIRPAPAPPGEEALPWADPYILGLIRKLQQEVRMERAARFMSEREAAEMADEDGDDVEYDNMEYDGLVDRA